MAFPESFLQELSEKNDIVDVVSGYVHLTKRSGQNLFGLCPFHSEKTPSFSVSPGKQIYHCFGCGKGGSVINFIMEIENLSFPDAVGFLARRAGMTVPEQDFDPNKGKRQRLYDMNRDAARYFREQLLAPGGEIARQYMARRGIGSATATNFGLGFAPDSWDGLVLALRAKGYSERELTEAGLVRQGKKGGVYDTFRSRLMFPVIDVRGNVIAFSGRILGDGEPKYMNSPETLVFSKSHNLFGLNLAKKSKSGYIILVEGNIDVVSLHQAGFDCAVASLGTSLTPEQARLLSRYTGEVIIAYDADGAGVKASQRAIGLLEKLELKVRVLTVRGAKDPDEFIKAHGADAFRNLLAGSENQKDYRLEAIASKYDMSGKDGKLSFLAEATDFLARLPSSVDREIFAVKVAEMVGVKPEAVLSDVDNYRKRKVAVAKKAYEREVTRPMNAVQPKARELRYENPVSAAAEEGCIRLMYLDSSLFRDAPPLTEGDFSSPALWKIFSELRLRAMRGEHLSPAVLSAALTQDEAALLTDILQKPETLSIGKRALGDYIETMRGVNRVTGATPADLLEIQKKLKEKKGYGG